MLKYGLWIENYTTLTGYSDECYAYSKEEALKKFLKRAPELAKKEDLLDCIDCIGFVNERARE